MISLRQLAGGVAVAAITMTIAGSAMAQQTTSVIRGTITDEVGTVIGGANVNILHTSSGTVKQTRSSASGVFSSSGLRVGGPYVITISAPGFALYQQDNVFLALGSPFQLNATLAIEGTDEIVVTATRGSFQNLATGPSSSFSAADILSTASISRDLKDILEGDPRVFIDRSFGDAFSVVGTNNRFNSFSVDGVRQNDDFGLNSNGYPTQRSPISIDVIEAVNLEIAPFDVQYTGFTGASINAVTKSGGNEFRGAAMFLYSSDELTGSKIDGNNVTVSDFADKTYSAYLSGPIIKDKLFFLASYERFDTSQPVNTDLPSSVTQADLDQITQISNSVYGFDPLGIPSSLAEKDEKYFGKIDWNINYAHRAAFSYQNTQGSNVTLQNFRRDDVSFSSNWYATRNKLESFKGEIFSNWTDQLSTEVKVAFKKVTNDPESLNGSDFAQFEIATAGGGAVFLGPDRFRQANLLNTKTLNIKAKADYQMKNHLFTVGYEYNNVDVFNLFVDSSEGRYTFDSIADFQNQVASGLRYRNALSNNENDAAAQFDFTEHTIYVQDTWQVHPDVLLTGGLRYDWIVSAETPNANPNFLNRYGFSNTTTFDGLDIVQPRFGFSWNTNDRTQISGGLGLFSGGNPNVWFANSFTNDGINIVEFSPGAIANPDANGNGIPDYLENVDGFNVNPLVQNALQPGDGEVNTLDPNFQIPSSWRYNFNVTHNFDLGRFGLGDDYRVTADVTYTDVKSTPAVFDLRLVQVGTAPDGRPIYDDIPGDPRASFIRDYSLRSVNAGGGTSLSFSVAKSYDIGVAFNVGYAYTDANDVNPGTSSRAVSSFGNFSASDLINTAAATSNYEIKHNVTTNLSYQRNFFKDFKTSFKLTGIVRSGRPFSYNFNSGPNPFGDPRQSREDRQLLYVPSGPGAGDDSNVVYGAGFDLAAFNAFIAESGLDAYRGQIAPRNAFNSPWWNVWDIRVSQEIPGFRKQDRLTLTMDIENVGNLIDSSWGVLREIGFEYNNPIIEADIVNNQYVFERFRTPFTARDVRGPSLWQVQFGIRYDF